MTRLAKVLRNRREIARTHRALAQAIELASTPAMRDELIIIAQRSTNR